MGVRVSSGLDSGPDYRLVPVGLGQVFLNAVSMSFFIWKFGRNSPTCRLIEWICLECLELSVFLMMIMAYQAFSEILLGTQLNRSCIFGLGSRWVEAGFGWCLYWMWTCPLPVCHSWIPKVFTRAAEWERWVAEASHFTTAREWHLNYLTCRNQEQAGSFLWVKYST